MRRGVEAFAAVFLRAGAAVFFAAFLTAFFAGAAFFSLPAREGLEAGFRLALPLGFRAPAVLRLAPLLAFARLTTAPARLLDVFLAPLVVPLFFAIAVISLRGARACVAVAWMV